jgi:hypothetical protein
MKKSQIFMAVAAFAFAAAGAIASNAGAQATTGWKFDNDGCLGVSASCPGGSVTCVLGTGEMVYKDFNCTITAKRN